MVLSRHLAVSARRQHHFTASPLPQDAHAPLSSDLGPCAEFANRKLQIADTRAEMPRDYPPEVCVLSTAHRAYDAVVDVKNRPKVTTACSQVMCVSMHMVVGTVGEHQVALLETEMG